MDTKTFDFPVTLEDVARATGLTTVTVSCALNGKGRVAARTQQRVLEAAKQMGYQRNELASAMANGKSRIVAYFAPNVEEEVRALTLAGALAQASEQDYAIKVIHQPQGLSAREVVAHVVDRCLSWKVCGIIATSLSQPISDGLCEALSRRQMPLVLVDNDAPQQDWGKDVTSDDAQGAVLALDHLLELGHECFAFLSGPESSNVAQVRAANFQEALSSHSPRSVSRIAFSDWSDKRIIESALCGLFDSPSFQPTALLCAADQLAMAAQRFARQRGLVVPKQLSVVGFANLALSAFADPPLTTVAQPFRDMGKMAVRHITCAEVGEIAERHVLPTILVVRESTAPRPKS